MSGNDLAAFDEAVAAELPRVSTTDGCESIDTDGGPWDAASTALAFLCGVIVAAGVASLCVFVWSVFKAFA